MTRGVRTHGRRAILATLAALLAGCGSTTNPGGSGPKHPMVGTYDVTTLLQTYWAPDPAVACMISNCPHKRVPAAAGSSFAGRLLVADSVVTTTGGAVRFPVDSMFASEVDCANGSSCFSRMVAYHSAGITLAKDTLSGTAGFSADGEQLYLDTGRFAGDSITGTFSWYTASGVASRVYDGTYVARRRR